MNIEEQFNLIAKEYDSGRRKFIPCFDDYYERTTDFLASCISEPKRILDLGAGTGLLSLFWFRHFPKASYLLLDVAGDMLDAARKRFDGLSNISFAAMDYTKGLPKMDFDCIISALSIHHLGQEKEELFTRIYEKLPAGGIFVNYDQFCGDSPEMADWYDSFWENQIKNSGISRLDLERWQERRKLDKECTVREEMEMLQRSGFCIVECVYSYQKFSVILAVK